MKTDNGGTADAAAIAPAQIASSGRRAWLFGGVAAAAALAGAGGAWWSGHATSGAAGERIDPAFWSQRFDLPDGGELSMAGFRGKPLLINFWATWCAPCVQEMPMIDAFFREHAGNGLQVVGLAIDQPSSVRKFLARTPVSYPIGLAGLQGTDMVKQLGDSAGGLPFSLMIDADGRIAARKMGMLENAELKSWHPGPVQG